MGSRCSRESLGYDGAASPDMAEAVLSPLRHDAIDVAAKVAPSSRWWHRHRICQCRICQDSIAYEGMICTEWDRVLVPETTIVKNVPSCSTITSMLLLSEHRTGKTREAGAAAAPFAGPGSTRRLDPLGPSCKVNSLYPTMVWRYIQISPISPLGIIFNFCLHQTQEDI